MLSVNRSLIALCGKGKNQICQPAAPFHRTGIKFNAECISNLPTSHLSSTLTVPFPKLSTIFPPHATASFCHSAYPQAPISFSLSSGLVQDLLAVLFYWLITVWETFSEPIIMKEQDVISFSFVPHWQQGGPRGWEKERKSAAFFLNLRRVASKEMV